MQSLLRDKAHAMSQLLVTEQKMSATVVGASPFLDMLAQLLQQLLPLLISCFATPSKAMDSVKAGLDWGQDLRLRLEIRKFFQGEFMLPGKVRAFADAAVGVVKSSSSEEMAMAFQMGA